MYKKYSNEIVAQKPQDKQALKREPIPYQVSPRRIDLIGRGEGGREQGEQALPLCRGAERNMGIKPHHKRTLELGRSTSSIPASPLPPSPCSPASGSEGQRLLSLYLRSELPNKTTQLFAVDGTENGFPCLKTAQFDEKNNKIVATRYCVQGRTLIPVVYQLLEVTH